MHPQPARRIIITQAMPARVIPCLMWLLHKVYITATAGHNAIQTKVEFSILEMNRVYSYLVLKIPS